MARTRPKRSPSQPKRTPPVAAPTRKKAVITPSQVATCSPVGAVPYSIVSSSARAGRAIGGKRPISKPSKSQPRSAAVRAIHLPNVEACCGGASAVSDARLMKRGSGRVAPPSEVRWEGDNDFQSTDRAAPLPNDFSEPLFLAAGAVMIGPSGPPSLQGFPLMAIRLRHIGLLFAFFCTGAVFAQNAKAPRV